MGLSNAASRARNYSVTVNQNQGGGSKKAGFPFIVGRTANVSRQFGCTNVQNGDSTNNRCCGLKGYQTTLFPNVNISRNIGRGTNADYWKVPGLAR